MVKSCCAVGCKNEFIKGGKLSFYKLPSDKALRSKQIAAVKRNNWTPSEYDRICSEHFVSGANSTNPLALNYVPGLFEHVKKPSKEASRKRDGEISKKTSHVEEKTKSGYYSIYCSIT